MKIVKGPPIVARTTKVLKTQIESSNNPWLQLTLIIVGGNSKEHKSTMEKAEMIPNLAIRLSTSVPVLGGSPRDQRHVVMVIT